MQIRRATLKDAAVLSQLKVDVQKLHVEAMPDHFKQPESDDFTVAFFEIMLAEPDTYIFIAEEEVALGYILTRVVHRDENPISYAQDYLYIDQISVRPQFRGKGYGGALIACAHALAREKGLPKVLLDTWYFNTQAQEFFHGQGFKTFNYRMWMEVNDQSIG